MTGDHCTVAQDLGAGCQVPFNQQAFADKPRNGFARIKNDFDAVCRARCNSSAVRVNRCTTAAGKYVLQDQWGRAGIGEPEIEHHGIAHRYVAQVEAGIPPVNCG